MGYRTGVPVVFMDFTVIRGVLPRCTGIVAIITSVRKATGALLAPLFAVIIFGIAWADNARDNTVNPGNAAHLGAVDQPAVVNSSEPGAGAGRMDVDCPDCQEQSRLDSCGCSGSCGTLEFFGPIAVINHHPPAKLFLCPNPEAATTLMPGEAFFRLKTDWVNNIIRELADGTAIDYDFEEISFTPEYHRGILGGEVTMRMPITHRGHGILDGMIADWHGWFGLLNGYRDDLPDRMYRYTIITRDGLVFNDEGDVFGIGDLSVEYKHSLFNRQDGNEALALRAGFKAPTGQSNKALGSGNWDFMAGVLYQKQFTRRLRGYANLDWVFVGDPDWNIAHQDMLIGFGALEYALRPGTTLVGQYRHQRNPLRTGNNEADKDSQELMLGFHHKLSSRLLWSGGFSEDINPETAPDFLMMSHFTWDF